MEIVLTKHAQERCELRGINLEMIKDTIINPEKRSKGYKERLLAFKKYEDRFLKVVYVIEENKYIILTAIWEERRQE